MKHLSKRWLKGVSLAFALCALGLFSLLFFIEVPPGEPVYKGRKLTAWIKLASSSPVGSGIHSEAQQAIADIGPTGVHYLFDALTSEPTASERLSEKLSRFGFNPLGRIFPPWSRSLRQINASRSLNSLGTNSPYASDYGARIAKGLPYGKALSVQVALAGLGRSGQLKLLEQFPDRSKEGAFGGPEEWSSVRALTFQKKIEPELIARLSQFATNADRNIWRTTLEAVKSLEGQPELKRLLLDRAFGDVESSETVDALWAIESTPSLLDSYRDRVSRAVPKLQDPHALALAQRLLRHPKASSE